MSWSCEIHLHARHIPRRSLSTAHARHQTWLDIFLEHCFGFDFLYQKSHTIVFLLFPFHIFQTKTTRQAYVTVCPMSLFLMSHVPIFSSGDFPGSTDLWWQRLHPLRIGREGSDVDKNGWGWWGWMMSVTCGSSRSLWINPAKSSNFTNLIQIIASPFRGFKRWYLLVTFRMHQSQKVTITSFADFFHC